MDQPQACEAAQATKRIGWKRAVGVSIATVAVLALVAAGAWQRWADLDVGKHFPLYDYVAAVLGLGANVLTAAAVVLAFRIWRRKVVGQTSHNLAVDVASALIELNDAREDVLREVEARTRPPSPLQVALELELRARGHQVVAALKRAAQRVAGLEPRLLVLWGSELAEVVRLIRRESLDLAEHLEAELGSDMGAKIVFVRTRTGVVPGGKAYKERIQALGNLAQEALSFHIGRPDSRILRPEDIAQKLEAISKAVDATAAREDEEIEELAAPDIAAAHEGHDEELRREEEDAKRRAAEAAEPIRLEGDPETAS